MNFFLKINTIKHGILTAGSALLLLCGCYTQQQQSAILPEPEWGKDKLFSQQEIDTKVQQSRAYQRRLMDAVCEASTISLEQYTIHAKSCKNRTNTGSCKCQYHLAAYWPIRQEYDIKTKTTKRTVTLARQEQEALKTLISRTTSVKNDDTHGIKSHSYAGTKLICTNAQGKRLFEEEVTIVPLSKVSKDGYAKEAHLAMHDDYYPLWQNIIKRHYPEVSAQEDAEAKAQHRQAVNALKEQLKQCETVKIETIGNIFDFIRFGKLNKTQTKQLCNILRRAAPLPFKGRIQGISAVDSVLCFYNAAGQKIGSLRVQDITDAASARTPQQCEAKESMYLPREDYKRLQEIISKQSDDTPTLSESPQHGGRMQK